MLVKKHFKSPLAYSGGCAVLDEDRMCTWQQGDLPYGRARKPKMLCFFTDSRHLFVSRLLVLPNSNNYRGIREKGSGFIVSAVCVQR